MITYKIMVFKYKNAYLIKFFCRDLNNEIAILPKKNYICHGARKEDWPDPEFFILQ